MAEVTLQILLSLSSLSLSSDSNLPYCSIYYLSPPIFFLQSSDLIFQMGLKVDQRYGFNLYGIY